MFLFAWPEWINFKYGKWTIKEGAPEEVKQEFYRQQQAYNAAARKGDILE